MDYGMCSHCGTDMIASSGWGNQQCSMCKACDFWTECQEFWEMVDWAEGEQNWTPEAVRFFGYTRRFTL